MASSNQQQQHHTIDRSMPPSASESVPSPTFMMDDTHTDSIIPVGSVEEESHVSNPSQPEHYAAAAASADRLVDNNIERNVGDVAAIADTNHLREPMSAPTANQQLRLRSKQDRSSDLESLQTPSEENDAPRPGAYLVPQRAIGAIPTWARPPQQNQGSTGAGRNDMSHIPPELRPIQSRNAQSSIPPELRHHDLQQSHIPPELRTHGGNHQNSTNNNSHNHIPPELRPTCLRTSDATTAASSQMSSVQSAGEMMQQQQNQPSPSTPAAQDRTISTQPNPQTTPESQDDPPKLSRRWLYAIAAVILGAGVFVAIFFILTKSDGENSESVSVHGNTPTNSPTAGNVEEIQVAVKGMLFNESATDETAWNDPASPQARALEWLIQSEGFLAIDDTEQAIVSRLVERYSLATLYYSTGGEGWTNQCDFLSELEVCQWSVSMDPGQNNGITMMGVQCDSDSRILGLTLLSNSLDGTLPDELEGLRGMQSLWVAGNIKLVGSIPASFFYGFRHLSSLRLGNNNLSGSIPADFPAGDKFTVLNLHTNSLEGTLDFVRSMVNLSILHVNRNLFTGPVVFPVQAPNLRSANFAINGLTGSIPSNLGTRIPNLQQFSVDHNPLDAGTFPWQTFPNAELRQLGLINTALTGSIPENIDRFPRLQWLNLAFTRTTGSIPPTVGKLSTLIYLDLRRTEISGQLPSSLGDLKKLEFLNIESTFVNGTIPSTFANMESLEVLTVASTDISGNISFLCDGSTDRLLEPRVFNDFTAAACSCCEYGSFRK